VSWWQPCCWQRVVVGSRLLSSLLLLPDQLRELLMLRR
jgi:hypothetical protein